MKEVFAEYRVRIFWLTIGLLSSLAIAHSINSFEELLGANLLLIGFIPMVVYLGDAVGTQMEGVTIREISTSKHFSLKIFFKRQILLTLLVGISLALASFLLVYLFWVDRDIALVIGLSLFVSTMIAVLTGSLIPYMFWKFHQDPAEASGPIATVIQDFLSVMSLLIIATVIL